MKLSLFQTLGTVLAMRDAPISTHVWQSAGGVFVFPEGKCPFCKKTIRSSQIWRIAPGTLKGRWRITRTTNQLRFVPPIFGDNTEHPHVLDGNVCLGQNTGENATENALFLGMNPGGAYSQWTGNGDSGITRNNCTAAQERWEEFLSSVWRHDCDEVEDFFINLYENEGSGDDGDEDDYCEYCAHGEVRCGNENDNLEECVRERGHDWEHVYCRSEDGVHYWSSWPNTTETPARVPVEIPLRFPGVCLCVAQEFWCNSQEENGSLFCSRARGHSGMHRPCAGSNHRIAPDWGEPGPVAFSTPFEVLGHLLPSGPDLVEIVQNLEVRRWTVPPRGLSYSTTTANFSDFWGHPGAATRAVTCTEGNRTCAGELIDATRCTERSDPQQLRRLCSRTVNHDGPHIACGGVHNLRIWESEVRNEPF
jgi:hypothetical protein